VSTRQQRSKRPIAGPRRLAGNALGLLDPSETVALVVRSRRALLFACHRRRLGHEDLEDCYSQATLELLTRAGRGEGFTDVTHIANALEQKFLSRIHDRRRALNGRSPIQAALAGSLPIVCGMCGGVDVADARADVEHLAFLRHDLRSIVRLSHELSDDQRLVLASQLKGESCAEFCRKHGWGREKYRKVAQRARARLQRLHMDESARAQRDACVPLVRGRRISQQGHTYETSSPHT
jgi:DNA-directed RNA polymerase specialized sigma24 family protein